MQVPLEQLQQQLEQYNQAATAAGSKDAFGKQYFPTSFDTAGRFWIGQITPVVHYCMGGLEINGKAQVWFAVDSALTVLHALKGAYPQLL